MKTDKTLLLGNGLNRTLPNSRSWSDLMQELGSQSSEADQVPYPIEFERMAAVQGGMTGNRSVDAYKKLREQMSSIITDLDKTTPGQVHQSFRNLGFKHVVTTNYDSIFESMYNCAQLITSPGGYKNILHPISSNGIVNFYHAHGIGKWKNTLCLSHEHYISLITKIRNTFLLRAVTRTTRIYRG